MPHCWQHKKPPESIFDLQSADKLTGILLPLILQSPIVTDFGGAACNGGFIMRIFRDVEFSVKVSARSFEQASALAWVIANKGKYDAD